MSSELQMIDDEELNDTKPVAFVLPDSCTVVNNVVTVPRKYALRLASNIIIQVDLDT